MRFLIFLFLFLLLPFQAQASYWKSCSVDSEVLEDLGEKNYKIRILKGYVIAGHATKGSVCFAEGEIRDIHLDVAAPLGPVQLHYSYFDSATPDGVVSGESWTLPE